jgi:hypothetical protein
MIYIAMPTQIAMLTLIINKLGGGMMKTMHPYSCKIHFA